MENIRNFVIISHIDHGKSTLADRLLELTDTVQKRLMRPQYLDRLELERERGITIKMAPVRMRYHGYILNLIDTPGHSDFSYEVSRALAAVEGAVLLIDATQGIQAQTLANFEAAKRAGLKIIGAVNKIDIARDEQIAETAQDVSNLLKTGREEIFKISGKTGQGAEEILRAVIEKVPPPQAGDSGYARGLIFDSFYDEHKGVIASVRAFSGGEGFSAGENAVLLSAGAEFKIKETGYFSPELKPSETLKAGEIGYIATGIKDAGKIKIGDTIIAGSRKVSGTRPLPGYEESKPVVFVSFYPEVSEEYSELKQALLELRLNDSSLAFEPDMSELLGRGFKGGFLGRLHFEITAERLAREFNIKTVHSFPSVNYQVKIKRDGWVNVNNPKDFPEDAAEVLEPIAEIEILTPARYIGSVLKLKELFRFSGIELKTTGAKTLITAKLPMSDLISDLDDKLKSSSEGFASLSYEIRGLGKSEVVKMEILAAGTVIPGLSRIIPKKFAEYEARKTVLKLKELLPRMQFAQTVQARVWRRIIARETVPALRKDVTGYLYGGDRTRKLKLWKKQQRGKKRLKEQARKNQVRIPAHIFKELLKK